MTERTRGGPDRAAIVRRLVAARQRMTGPGKGADSARKRAAALELQLDELDAAMTIEQTPLSEILLAPCGAEIRGDGGYMRLFIAERTFPPGSGDALRQGPLPAATVTATQDAQPVVPLWHDGDPDAEVVFYEQYAEDGRIAHGWVDRKTRKVVQSG